VSKTVSLVVSYEADMSTRIQSTLNSMEEMATRLSVLPGRTNLAWVTEGIRVSVETQQYVQGEPRNFMPPRRPLSEVLDRSGSARSPGARGPGRGCRQSV